MNNGLWVLSQGKEVLIYSTCFFADRNMVWCYLPNGDQYSLGNYQSQEEACFAIAELHNHILANAVAPENIKPIICSMPKCGFSE